MRIENLKPLDVNEPEFTRSYNNPRNMEEWGHKDWSDYYCDLAYDEWTIRHQRGITDAYIKGSLGHMFSYIKLIHCT